MNFSSNRTCRAYDDSFPSIRRSEDNTSRESKRENIAEAITVALLADALASCGLNEKDIGVISPYRNQLRTIEKQVCVVDSESGCAW